MVYLNFHFSVCIPDSDNPHISWSHEKASLLLPVHHHPCPWGKRKVWHTNLFSVNIRNWREPGLLQQTPDFGRYSLNTYNCLMAVLKILWKSMNVPRTREQKTIEQRTKLASFNIAHATWTVHTHSLRMANYIRRNGLTIDIQGYLLRKKFASPLSKEGSAGGRTLASICARVCSERLLGEEYSCAARTLGWTYNRLGWDDTSGQWLPKGWEPAALVLTTGTRTGPFPLKENGLGMDVLMALQWLQHCGHPGPFLLTWGVVLASEGQEGLSSLCGTPQC